MTTTWQDKCDWFMIALKYSLAVGLVLGVCGLLVPMPGRAVESGALSAAVRADAEAGIKETSRLQCGFEPR
jgi:hypothetical protein